MQSARCRQHAGAKRASGILPEGRASPGSARRPCRQDADSTLGLNVLRASCPKAGLPPGSALRPCRQDADSTLGLNVPPASCPKAGLPPGSARRPCRQDADSTLGLNVPPASCPRAGLPPGSALRPCRQDADSTLIRPAVALEVNRVGRPSSPQSAAARAPTIIAMPPALLKSASPTSIALRELAVRPERVKPFRLRWNRGGRICVPRRSFVGCNS